MTEIKVVVFDMDGTFYRLDDVIEMNYSMQLNFFLQHTNYDMDTAKEMFRKNGIFSIVSEKSKSATEFFSREGLDLHEWNSYREEHFNVKKINLKTCVNNATIKQISKFYTVVLLSSNSYRNIIKVLNYLHIEISNFQKIICSDKNYEDKNFNKNRAFNLIHEQYNVPYEKILSIGDRYNTDIKPLEELGGRGIVVKEPKDIKIIAEELCQ